MRTLKESESLIQKKRSEMAIKKSKEAEEIKRSMIEIGVKGKIMTPRTRQRLESEGISFKSFTNKKMSMTNGMNNFNY